MTKLELLMEGVNLMFSGMGFVIGFLILLIFLISLMSNMINRFSPPPLATTSTENSQISVPKTTDDIERLRPVIIAAIAHHRRQQGIK
ncbi:oxaloacetate decarboxylase subunit gamma [Gallibacterium anatis]|uniref:Probable oxaloacetate decarboxylase gamma chain n=1 Tax=Gallibacterium anatis TaxID=750 RepID=A0A0A2XLG9_9PAST|nr:oxaloacetate decarboxylase subunit gamma [Gallibacterium anatis]KGQ33053.1 oxaloacetate decarboxylase gamma chain [Gallibacterium anatis]